MLENFEDKFISFISIYFVTALVLCAYATDVKETEKAAEPATNKDKRQTQDELVQTHYQYRVARKQVCRTNLTIYINFE